ncbi:MAG: hypothetical protein QOF18_1142, partial [Frankiaceae bacterium]|nr:hypothetical protein [Frankiaceae bacterium]
MTGKRRLGREPKPPRRVDPAPSTAAPPASPPSPGTIPQPGQPQPFVIAPRKTRRELRADRRRQKRKRLGVAGIAGVVVAGLIAVAAITFGVQKATSGGHHTSDRQTTLLFSLVAIDRTAVESALLAHDGHTHQGVELLMPARALTEVCGFGNQQLGQVLALPDGQRLARSAVSDLLGGVTVNGSWSLTIAQLTRLVDEAGGITADVDVDVIEHRVDGSRVLLVPRGAHQKLTGSQAVAFATYTAGGEDAAANLVRLQQVIDGLLAALPTTESGVQRLLTSLGAGATSTLGPAKLSALLVGLAADAQANNVLPTDLPVVKIDSGSSQPSYRVDADQTRQFVTSNLSASLPTSAVSARKRVFVQNGVGTPGLVGSACTKLV